MKRALLLSFGLVSLAFAGPASALPLSFDFSGPSGTALFRLDSHPVPDFSTSLLSSEQFGFHNVPGTFGGMPGTASTISFGSGIFSSFSITDANLGFTQFGAPTLFTGPATMPVFSTGSFTLINPFFGNGKLAISKVLTAVPELATWAMLLVGFAVIGAGARDRRRRASVSFG